MPKIKLFIEQSWLLLVSAFFFGLLIAGANAAWEGQILQNQKDKFNNLAKQLITGAVSFEAVPEAVQVSSGNRKTIATEVQKALDAGGNCIGWAFICEGPGFADKIKIVMTVDAGFEKMLGFGVLSSNETPGFGDQIKLPYYREQYQGIPADEVILSKTGDSTSPDSEIVAISGATVSSQAVVDIVNTFVPQVKQAMQERGLIDNE